MKKTYDYLVVGAGLYGSVFAHQAQKAGKSVLIIDKREHTGGNIFCEDVDGINVHKYGAHIFHTSNREVWDFVNSHVEFNRYTNSPLAYYDGKIYNLPFNMNTFNQLWGVITPEEAKEKIEREREKYRDITEPQNLEEQALILGGKEIYEIFIKGYTEKQWGMKATELPAFIIRRLPFRFTYNNNYFNDSYQGIPIGGYNKLTDSLLKGVNVRLGCDYFDNRAELDSIAKKIVYTGCIDQLFDYEFGELEYRGLRFENERFDDVSDFQGNAVVNYNNREVPFTRIIEHKHFEFGTQDHTVITREYPSDFKKGDEPYYPINDDKNNRLYNRYRERAESIDNLILGGRLAEYSYYDMDDTVEAALLMSKRELQ